ncbi:transporter substrate-binding domain-containing protein [Bdellovibrio bacteriovorus]|uniref:substrate-binding periplasmic protein n=1 Tax=Bdellovibrio bacteriovorus TaxID=959 RepID=UPI0021D15A8A|nr:transporter substrate-binding domain-containing protein [Bdellovibrio bacteriovorus]UXR64233.1 transporter substrate-binding domain-containing protein [Bdellovibrio bacteriovorus]
MKQTLIFWILLLGSLAVAQEPSSMKPLVMGLPFQVKRVRAIMEYQEFINRALADAGYGVVIQNTPAQRPYELLTQGKLDAIIYDDKSFTEQREQTVSLSFPLIRTHGRIFYLGKNLKFNEHKLKAFRGGISINNHALSLEANQQKLKYIHTVSPLQSVAQLVDGKIDYFIAIEEVGRSAIEAYPAARGKVSMGQVSFMTVPLYLTFHKKLKPDLPRIEAAFRKALTGDLSKYPLIMENLNKNP